MIADDSSNFYASVRSTANKLNDLGFGQDAQEIQNSLIGSTGGEVLGGLGCILKRISKQGTLPEELRAEIQDEIHAIDLAFDRVSQPRPCESMKKAEAH